MMILEKYRENRNEVRQIGVDAVLAARKAGIPAYYRMRGKSGEIVREMPDGTRQVVRISNGNDVVLRALKPRIR
ncbi:hypothetical protein BO068_005291 [Escherichia coli]|nr:hypothetical protein [Escherichia coli]